MSGAFELVVGICKRQRRVLTKVLVLLIAVSVLALGAPSNPAGASSSTATHFVINTAPSAVVGQNSSVTVTAEDSSGNVVTGFTDLVSFTSSDPLAMLPGAIDKGYETAASGYLTSGVGTFEVAFNSVGYQTITTTDSSNPSINGVSSQVDVMTPAPASIVSVGGVLGGVSMSPTNVTPAFSPLISNYVTRCASSGANAFSLTLSGAGGSGISAEGQSGSSISVPVDLMPSQAVVVEAASPTNPGSSTQYWIRCLPPDFPVLNVTEPNGPPPPGWYLTGNAIPSRSVPDSPYAIILDSNGTPVWWRAGGHPGFAGGNLKLFSNDTLTWWTDGNYMLFNLNTQSFNSVTANGGISTDPHDILQLPNGDYYIISQLHLTNGVNLSAIGDGTNQTISDCQVQELSPTGQVLWSWLASQHVGPDESTRAVALTFPGVSQKVWDVFHCNALSVDPSSSNPATANLLVSMRNTDEVYLINHATGSVIWQTGGGVTPASYEPNASAQVLKITGDPATAFYGQHDASFEPNGDISVFDDHTPRTGVSGPARAVEYHVDTATGTASMVQQFVQPQGLTAEALGSFTHVDSNGDRLVAWGLLLQPPGQPADFMTEYNSSGQVLMNVMAPNGDYPYRSIKLPPSALDLNQLRESMGGLPPTVASVSPNFKKVGASPTPVTISGSGFTGSTAVSFGSEPASSVVINSDSSITATPPIGSAAQSFDVTVTGPNGTSAVTPADEFAYEGAPVVTSLSRSTVPYSSYTQVVVRGSGFLGTTKVLVGSTSAAFHVVSYGEVDVTVPPGDNGSSVDVSVTTPFGTSISSPGSRLTYGVGGTGLRMVGQSGGVFSFGGAQFYGSMGGKALNRPIVGIASTPDGGGYWEVASDGGVFSFGDARFYGSTSGVPLNQPIVGLVATRSGEGYWEVGASGGIYAIGDAAYLDSLPNEGVSGLRITGVAHG